MTDLKRSLGKAISKASNISESEAIRLLSETPNPSLGDLAFPCFRLAKKQNPAKVAKELSKRIKLPQGFSQAKAYGAYLNFFFDREFIISTAISTAIRFPKKRERIMVEFSQPNTHKAFHIGHLRNLSLGDALVRILRFAGYEVIAANYIGDIGTHVAKSLWYINKYCKRFPKESKGEWLANIYVKSARLLESKTKLMKEVAEVHKALDDGVPYWLRLWKETREWSLQDFNRIYNELGVIFDIVFFESEIANAGREIAKQLLKGGIAVKDQGSLLVDLRRFNLGVFLILKSDATPLYSTKDLELARRKFEDFNIQRSIYVVGSEQELYFKQLFKTLELMGFKHAKQCVHLSYGLVQLASGKMSSRLGNVITYEELKARVFKRASKEVKKRHKDWNKDKIRKVSKEIALSAMKFTMLNKELKRTIVFDTRQALSFEGESGPYLQYVYTRCSSILKKAGADNLNDYDPKLLNQNEEFELAKKIVEFPGIVNEICTTYRINLLPRHLLDLAQLFNHYYQKHRVIQSNKEIMRARLALVNAVARTIQQGLGLLGINTVEEM